MLGSAAPVLAQSAEPDAKATVTGIQDIVVTAQRRSEAISKVPITITALSEEQLELRGLQNTMDLQHSTPGITFGQSAGFTNFYIRGIGNAFATPVAQSPVAFYVDGVYIADISSTVFEMSDVEQVEILKGPQGTLYGRNAVGGAISIRTKVPRPGTEARAQVGYGNYDDRRASLYLNGGNELLQANASIAYHESDGYYKNLIPGERDLNAADTLSVRGKVRLVPSDGVEFILAGDYIRDRGYGFAGGGANDYPETVGPGTTVVTTDVLLGGQVTNRPWRTTYRGDFSNVIDNWGVSLTSRFDLGGAKLNSITAYRSFDFEHSVPSGASSFGGNILRSTDFHYSFSQELQLLSDNDGPLSWIGGLYYLNDDAGFDPLAISRNVGAPLKIDIFSKVRVNSYAAFGEATYSFDNGISVIGGLRYTHDDLKHYQARQNIALPFPPFAISVNSSGAEASFSALTPRVSVKYESDNALYYATYSKGYRAGLFNASAIAPTAALDVPVNPEKLDAYEVGAKWQLFNNAVHLNVAGFYYVDKNMQLQSLFAGGGTRFENASGKIKGIDVEAEWRISDALTVRASGEYLHARYSQYRNAAVYVAHSIPTIGSQQGVSPCPGADASTILFASCPVSLDLSGDPLMRAPKFTGTISADLKLPLPEEAGTAILTGSLYHSDRFRTTANGTQNSPSYELVNLGLRYTLPNETTSVRFYVNNVTNAKYFVTAGEQELSRGLMYGAPRMYGVNVTFQTR